MEAPSPPGPAVRRSGMKHHRPLSLALLTSVVLAWTLPAYGYGNCANGKTLYNKTNAVVVTACSNSSCHKSTVNANKIQNGAGNPGDISYALDGNGANQEM